MNDRSKPALDIPDGVLRDGATRERIDRVWSRIENDLPSSSTRQRAALWWAPAAVVIVFGAGVFVGTRWAYPAPSSAALVQAEPMSGGEAQRPPEAYRPSHASEPVDPESTLTSPRTRRPLRAPIALPVEGPALVEVAEPLPSAVEAPTPEWQRLAALGDYEAAHRALESGSGFDAAADRATAEQLMLLHDLARIKGQRARATSALRKVVERHRGDPNAPLAAYTLGTLLEKDGDRAGAAAAFTLYRELAPKGDLAEDVLARQVEVALEQGDLGRARELARQYARDYPNGDGLAKFEAQLAVHGDAGLVPLADAALPADPPAAASGP